MFELPVDFIQVLILYPDGEFYKIELERILIENNQIREENQKLKKNHNALQIEFQSQFCSRKFGV